MSEMIQGSCLCGQVTYELEDTFETYNLCHCTQCQKISGSAHVSNMFTAPSNIKWLSGEELLVTYDVPGREIRNVFCKSCGCNMPYVTHSGRFLLVPAGSLDKAPSLSPEQVIFWRERQSWYDHLSEIDKFDGFRE